MIDIKTAQELVLLHSSTITKIVEFKIENALDYVLALDVTSEIDMPPFRQSAMDGYAINKANHSTYSVVGEVKAGDNNNLLLKVGEAVRIFTGAPVPDTANAVVMQEKVTQDDSLINIDGEIQDNINIRPRGEQIKEGDIALVKGTVIKGSHIGFLASLGVTKISVYQKPSIAVIVTGNELVSPGKSLAFGEIYESNGVMLTAVLNELGYKNSSLIKVKDNYETTKKSLSEAIKNHDVVIVTGGVSVGDYDFVSKALKAIEVEEIFYKVKQKPGKPLFFGKKENVSIFGLPGNPAAALSCFYIYVYPLLKKSEGATTTNLQRIVIPMISNYTVQGNRAQFLKAKIEEDGVEILEGQSSAMIRAFGNANALVLIPENSTQIQKGENVKAILLPNK
ncbi:molybdopterin molybdotransferase MoeA [Winogradskyella jejuensis]|uniref:Molybdopterin molybdenumtransferase n=1 Tax=Winogradskyella jejuensis TaxID=1089305 RepID=A0A1M5KT65_9FLAO|nr:gephyrin-like molybdotransferase Glp [Winogradskyella jejuensis]SHG55971.1 molybdopterin molybdochelatase [Winogradskyella jejuensis]